MNNSRNPQAIVLWALWAAFQIGIFFMYMFLHVPANSPRMRTTEGLPWLVGLVPLGLSVLVRWAVLPRAKAVQQALAFMVMGIAFAEATVFFGMFLLPLHQRELFILGALGIFQFIPLYARRFLEPNP